MFCPFSCTYVLLCLFVCFHRNQTTLTVLATLLKTPEVVAGAGCTELYVASHIQQAAAALTIQDVDNSALALASIRMVATVYVRCLEAIVRAFCVKSFASGDSWDAANDSALRAIETLYSINQRAPPRGITEAYGWDPLNDCPMLVLSRASSKPGCPCFPASAPVSADSAVLSCTDVVDGASDSSSDEEVGDVIRVVEPLRVRLLGFEHAVEAAVAVLRIEGRITRSR